MNLHTALNLSPDRLEVVSFIGAGGKSTAMFRLADEMVTRGERVITTTTTRIAAEQIRQAPSFIAVVGDRLPIERIGAALARHGHCLLIGRDSARRGAADKKAGIEPDRIDELVQQRAGLGLSAILVEADGSRMLPAKAPAAHEPAVPSSTTLVVSLVGMDAAGLPIADPYVHRPARIRSLLRLPQTGNERLTPSHAALVLRHAEGGRRGLPEGARFLALLNKADSPPRLAMARLAAQQLSMNGHRALIGAVGAAQGDPVLERWGPITAVVLAAGGSTRMGKPKQMTAVDGEAMVVRAARLAVRSGVPEVLVVTGAYGDEVAHLLAPLVEHGKHCWLPSAAPENPMVTPRIRLVHNPRWQRGQASSIRAAVEALSAATAAVIFLPADQPFMGPTLLRRLQQVWRAGAWLATPRVEGQVRGAPALFDRRYWPELLALRGDVGARGILHHHRSDVISVPVGADSLRDMDRPDHL